jgi:hypothetical protein
MSKTITTITKNIEHPLEEVFDIERGSTVITREEQHTELLAVDGYDAKDQEIEEGIQEVFDKAMSAYTIIQDECEDIEGRYLPRMMEVGVQHLKLALDAVNSKAKIKELKDKLVVSEKNKGPKTVNQNLFVNREDLLAALLEGESIKPEAEAEE